MLSELAKKGKAHWDYPQEWLDLWDNDLTISRQLLSQSITYAAMINNELKGFCLLTYAENCFELEHLWLDTKLIGKGVGGLLMEYVLDQCQSKAKAIEVSADPYARGFYEKYGFRKISEIASLPVGRTIPRLRLEF